MIAIVQPETHGNLGAALFYLFGVIGFFVWFWWRVRQDERDELHRSLELRCKLNGILPTDDEAK